MPSSVGGPLAGLKVVELAGIGPAPFACMMLAELGADVVRIDRIASGEARGPDLTGGLNRSRASIAVDLKSSSGRDVALRLVEQADVLIEGMRPGATEDLGIGPDACLARNPRLVYGRMTGWGQVGPWASMAGHDINYAALSGALHVSGPPERPIPPVNVLADFGGGALYLLVGVLSALTARERTGRGQVVDAAMVDGAASLITMIYAMHGKGLWQDERGVNLLDGGAPYYDTYECSDGRFVAVGAIEPAFYAALLEGLGLPDLPGPQNDRDAWPAHRAALAARFRSRTRDEWAAVFEGTDACVAPVLSLSEAPEHPHMSARGAFASVDGAVQPVLAPRFSVTSGRAPTPEHRAGADTEAVLVGWGWSAEEIRELLGEGAIQQTSEWPA